MACVSYNLHVLLTSDSNGYQQSFMLNPSIELCAFSLLSLGLIIFPSVAVSGCGHNKIPPIIRDTFIPSS